MVADFFWVQADGNTPLDGIGFIQA